ncbi:GPALPP motifs-containing protein 1 [Ambystoma mexicanum]|uniref:GPALPP motifs-containing protein 1 n=1 Tax=Ambystoma mexicanum TaxID=8296 RepID=UPI0037E9AE7E
MSRELIGPALPPGFKVRARDPDEANQVSGPALPPGFKSCQSSGTSDDSEGSIQDSDGENSPSLKRRKHTKEEEEDDNDFFGPALPPGFKKQTHSPDRVVIGPALPPGFKKENQDSNSEDNVGSSESESETADSSSEEEGGIGPTPAKSPGNNTVVEDFVRREQKMKEKLSGGDDESTQVARESWMTELPPELTNFGLGPRTFKRRTNEKSGDRSIWTDTPAEREKKAKEKQEGKASTTPKAEEEVPLSQRDQKLAVQVSSYNDSKRAESLMDIHQKKLKQKAKEEKKKPQERRPFDRDQDLKVNQFDDAQKKALVKKSRELNTRFSHGKSNMFL